MFLQHHLHFLCKLPICKLNHDRIQFFTSLHNILCILYCILLGVASIQSLQDWCPFSPVPKKHGPDRLPSRHPAPGRSTSGAPGCITSAGSMPSILGTSSTTPWSPLGSPKRRSDEEVGRSSAAQFERKGLEDVFRLRCVQAFSSFNSNMSSNFV